MVQLKVKKLHSDAKVPQYALPGDAALDLFTTEEYIIQPGERHVFPTGVAMELPVGYVSLIWDKSGLSAKNGLKVLGGVIEHTYRGEYLVCLVNTGSEPHHFLKGDKIAQLLIQPIITADIIEVDKLSETERGDGKYGHTGR